MGRAERSVLDLSTRLRGAHAPPVPAGADVPPLPGRARRRRGLPRPLDRLRVPARRGDVGPARSPFSHSGASGRRATCDDARPGPATSRAPRRRSSSTTAAPRHRRVGRGDRPARPGEPARRPTGPGYRWVDLDGEGLSGVLTEQGGAWFYKPNLGPGPSRPDVRSDHASSPERPAMAALAGRPPAAPRPRRRRRARPGRLRRGRRRASRSARATAAGAPSSRSRRCRTSTGAIPTCASST